jgi:hypothetical protein
VELHRARHVASIGIDRLDKVRRSAGHRTVGDLEGDVAARLELDETVA